MTLLSRKADYALLILSHLDGNPAGGNARTIAARFDLSRPFVANILKELCHKGFVTSHRGVKGGYVLARSPAEVTLAELLEAIDEGFRLAVCVGDEPRNCCLSAVCTVQGPIAEVHRRMLAVLQHVTLAEIFRPSVPGTPSTVALPLLQLSVPACPKLEPELAPA